MVLLLAGFVFATPLLRVRTLMGHSTSNGLSGHSKYIMMFKNANAAVASSNSISATGQVLVYSSCTLE
jgi:hypothetical protein